MKILELEGEDLDRAVARHEVNDINEIDDPHFYSTDWALAGPIIEREKISIELNGWGADEEWVAYIRHDEEVFGPTPLVAAMRCFVSHKEGGAK